MTCEHPQAGELEKFISKLTPPPNEHDLEVMHQMTPATEIFNLPQSAIDNATIRVVQIDTAGACYLFRLEAFDKDMLMRVATERKNKIDSMRSPKLGNPWQASDGMWAVELSYYGLG